MATLQRSDEGRSADINTKLKTGLRHFKKRAGDVAANAATMALIAENARLYVADTKKPNEGKKWTEFAAQMRAAAGELAAKAHAGDEAGANAADGQTGSVVPRLPRRVQPGKAMISPSDPREAIRRAVVVRPNFVFHPLKPPPECQGDRVRGASFRCCNRLFRRFAPCRARPSRRLRQPIIRPSTAI